MIMNGYQLTRLRNTTMIGMNKLFRVRKDK